jgi:hypothetical protein
MSHLLKSINPGEAIGAPIPERNVRPASRTRNVRLMNSPGDKRRFGSYRPAPAGCVLGPRPM